MCFQAVINFLILFSFLNKSNYRRRSFGGGSGGGIKGGSGTLLKKYTLYKINKKMIFTFEIKFGRETGK